MTDKEKLEKIKALADKMYSRMSYLTSDTRPIRQAMDEYHQFIINEYHKEEPVSNPIDFEKELYKSFGQVKDFTLGLQIAKRFYDMGKNHQEPVSEQNLSNVERIGKDWKEDPVSEDLEEACAQLSEDARKHKAETSSPFFSQTDYKQGVMDGAKWQKEHL